MQLRYKKLDYTTPSAHEGGPGINKQIPWYFNTPYINMTAAQFQAVSAAVGASLGDVWWLGGGSPASGGNAFMFVHYDEAQAGLVLGQLVACNDPTAGTVSAVPQSTAILTQSFSTVAGGVNGEVNNWVFVTSAAVGATVPQLRRIKANNAAATGALTVSQTDFMRPNTPLDADVFDSIPLNPEVTNIIRPWHVKLNTATTVPIGVALGTVTSGNFTIIQVAGLAAVQSSNSGANVVAMVPATGGAAGVMTGTAAASIYQGGTLILPLVANAAAPVLVQPAYVNFLAA